MRWMRNNALGLAAIFIALGGTAVATNVVGDGGRKQVVVVERSADASAAKKGKKGKRGPRGPAGPQGPAGPSTGPAGGDLAGSYPNPSLKPPESWREVGAVGEPPFAGTWTNAAASTNSTAAFYRDPQGVVHLKGLVGGGSNNTAVFFLPPGYRPSKTAIFPGLAVGSTQIGTITVNSTGTVVPFVASTTQVSLEGITFRACGAAGAEPCP